MERDEEDAIVADIQSHGYRRIAIQSSNVSAAARLCTSLQERFRSSAESRDFYVLGDVFIGSCCTDVIAARRCNSDYVIHLGDSCQSFVESPVPIRLSFDRTAVEGNRLCEYLSANLSNYHYDRLLVAYHPSLHHLVDDLAQLFSNSGTPTFIAECRDRVGSSSDETDHAGVFCGRRVFCYSTEKGKIYVTNDQWLTGDKNTLVVFITTGAGITEDHLALSSAGCQFHVVRIDNHLMHYNVMDNHADNLRLRRYHKVEKVQEASTIGILVIARTITGSTALRRALARLLEAKGKRHQIFSVNCLTEAKLANMPNIDIFCMLSCAESVLSLPDELARRVVYPFELLVALGCIDWSTPYEFDFVKLLRHIPDVDTSNKATANSGEIRRLQGNGAIQPQLDSFMETLQDNSKRTFGGVDPSEGLSNEPTILPGFHGIASRYNHETHG
ncbi:diphthamide biosynthesis [Babesia ovis]|uniref:Diphthamide biosynthesis n=1 Tax=Babesia ovis TaxID=5869 RepID=A0A9W5T9W1_BABOV|nr:diphthamide biosynthesis [Babesia ovis]